jgi:uncharacterized Rmd1/YagE family protein
MSSNSVQAEALVVGEEIDLRRLPQAGVLSREPFTVAVEDGGTAVLFRFGVVVLFDVAAAAEATFLALLRPFVKSPFEQFEKEVLTIRVAAGNEERMEQDALLLPDSALPRLQVVADVLAKSVLLESYEHSIAGSFDRIEPLAQRMQKRGRLPHQAHRLIEHISEVLQIQHRMVARAQVGEKPDLLWEHPELERLWRRLEHEYDISERQLALERKLDLISTTVETLLELLQNRRSLRVEWYIVILIVVEIALTLYEMFFRHG